MNYSLFVSCSKGLEYLVEDEVKHIGLKVTKVTPQGVYGDASLALIYQLCLWSRLANRIQIILFNGQAYNQQTIYNLCKNYPWHTLFTADNTFAIEFHGFSNTIRNSMFGAQIIKDAIVDYFQQFQNKRPNVDKDKPQIFLHAYFKDDFLSLSYDVTGYSLHQRGYRLNQGSAPIKENLAAALLYRSNWPILASKGYAFCDFFCGSGTIVIEAAMMAANIAPGILRQDQAFVHCRLHQASLWEKLRSQALKQVKGLNIKLYGFDNSDKAIETATQNARRAGVLPLVEFKRNDFKDTSSAHDKGLIISNPPYGERMEDPVQLIPVYQQIGKSLFTNYQNWQANILTAHNILAKAIGLRSNKQYNFYNGPIETTLYCFTLDNKNILKDNPNTEKTNKSEQIFYNRLKKNFLHRKKWAQQRRISCYRVYDADLPDYAFAIDIYDDHAILQEYAAPKTIPNYKAENRILAAIKIVTMVLRISPDKLIIKKRIQQKGLNQYQKLNNKNKTFLVAEGKARFKVNLHDYLDTGIFLDLRLLRMEFAKLSSSVNFLNCFCYTATASIHAALAGALTVNVDLSKTYLNWAQDNFKINKLDLAKHKFIQTDCLNYFKICRENFDVIFLNPPSFSNSKSMVTNLDVQRDQGILIKSAMRLLKSQGKLYFVTNLRTFKLDPEITEIFSVKNLNQQTIDLDFKRRPNIHHCFLISHKENKTLTYNK